VNECRAVRAFARRLEVAVACGLVAALAAACEHSSVAPGVSDSDPRPSSLPALDVVKRFIAPDPVATFDGSGQVAHPDVVYTPPGAFAYPWHLVLTPTPYGIATYEDPSVYASVDGVSWRVEPGAVNPVAQPRPDAFGEQLSDPALVYVPEARELWLYYRSFTADSDLVWLTRSGDAITWTEPAVVLAVASGEALSPSVVHRAPTQLFVRESADGLSWSSPAPVSLPGLMPWHVFVRWVDGLSMWVMATNVKRGSGSCLTRRLYLATSGDGLEWTPRARPWLVAGGDLAGLFSAVVYRTAFAEVGDSLRFWYSGASSVDPRCDLAGAACPRPLLRWSSLGTEIRPLADVVPR